MSGLLDQIDKNISTRNLLLRDQCILVAVSGGLDSMVLLHALHRLAGRHGWTPVVAHFNHRLRGRSSDADERLVEKSAKKLGLKFTSERGDVRAHARKHKVSIEMAARELRHDFLARTATMLGISTVVTAHHADDQVELFFLRVLRGAGGDGLAGMDWKGPSPSDPRILLARPLLNVRKEDLKTWAAASGISFREDASNALLDHDRNRIRNQLLPLLRQKYQPALVKTTLRLMEILSAETDFVRESAHLWEHKRNAPPFRDLHRSVQRQWLQMELLRLGIPPEFELIERLREVPGQVVMVDPSLTIWRDEQGTIHSRPVSKSTFKTDEFILELSLTQGATEFGGVQLCWRIEPLQKSTELNTAGGHGREYFDAHKVGSAIILRHWRPGDRYQPIGMSAVTKVQDVLTNQKVPRARRHELVIATTPEGEIFWVEGLRISERFKLTRETVCALQWKWKRTPSQNG